MVKAGHRSPGEPVRCDEFFDGWLKVALSLTILVAIPDAKTLILVTIDGYQRLIFMVTIIVATFAHLMFRVRCRILELDGD